MQPSRLILGVLHRGNVINPASMKQALMLSARRLPGVGVFEQGLKRFIFSKDIFFYSINILKLIINVMDDEYIFNFVIRCG